MMNNRTVTDAEDNDERKTSTMVLVRSVLHECWNIGGGNLRLRVIVAMILLVLGKIATTAGPYAFGKLVDGLGVGREIDTTWGGDSPIEMIMNNPQAFMLLPIVLVVSYGLARVLSIAFNQLRDAAFASVIHQAASHASIDAFGHMHSLGADFHLSRQTGALARSLDAGMRGIETMLRFLVSSTVPVLVELSIIMIIFLGYFGAVYSISLAIMVAIYLYFTRFISRWRTSIRRNMNDSASSAASITVDSLMNYETTKYFGNEGHEINRYAAAMKRYQSGALRASHSLGLLNFGQSVIFSAGIICLLTIALYQVAEGTLTAGDIVMLNTYLFQLQIPLNFVGTVYREISQAAVDVEGLHKLKTHPTEEITPAVSENASTGKNKNKGFDTGADKSNEPKVISSHSPPGLEFLDVCFSYPSSGKILGGVSFTVKPGQTLGIVGTTGSGKSTLARLLLRFYQPSSGKIIVGGSDVQNWPLAQLRSLIGVVPQDIVLFGETIGYNIRYGRLSATQQEVEEAAKQAAVHDFIVNLPNGYNTLVGERGLKLSGGEKQRIAIARVVLKNPPILLLDEATSSLDTVTEQDIQRTLGMIAKQRTTLVIAHRLSTVVEAEQIVVLESGKVIESGNHAELLNAGGKYAQMWNKTTVRSGDKVGLTDG